jgi:hypothetical protein
VEFHFLPELWFVVFAYCPNTARMSSYASYAPEFPSRTSTPHFFEQGRQQRYNKHILVLVVLLIQLFIEIKPTRVYTSEKMNRCRNKQSSKLTTLTATTTTSAADGTSTGERSTTTTTTMKNRNSNSNSTTNIMKKMKNIGISLRNELENIRRAITCPICLCTMKDPITLSGCSHTFCAGCIQQSFHTASSKNSHMYTCPLCQLSFTRRSIQTNHQSHLSQTIQQYKRLTQYFGIAPIQYTPSIPTCTQIETEDVVEDDDDDNESTVWDDDSVISNPSQLRRSSSSSSSPSSSFHGVVQQQLSPPRSILDIADQYHVSQYMYQSLQLLQHPQQDQEPSTNSNDATTVATVVPSSSSSLLLLQEQEQIVHANQMYYHKQKK